MSIDCLAFGVVPGGGGGTALRMPARGGGSELTGASSGPVVLSSKLGSRT